MIPYIYVIVETLVASLKTNKNSISVAVPKRRLCEKKKSAFLLFDFAVFLEVIFLPEDNTTDNTKNNKFSLFIPHP